VVKSRFDEILRGDAEMLRSLLAALAMLASVSVASAAAPLTDEQMDGVTAGDYVIVGGNILVPVIQTIIGNLGGIIDN
jgi:hypothetical protein